MTDPFADILKWNGSRFVKSDKELSEAESQNLIASAEALTHNDFFTSLLDSIRREGYRRFEVAAIETPEGMEAVRMGKTLLFLADVLAQKVVHASHLKIPKTTPPATRP